MRGKLEPARPGSSILECNVRLFTLGLVPIAYLMSRIVRFPFES